MEVATFIAGIIGAIAICVVLAVVMKFGFREREYDEVYGAQRQALAPATVKKAPKKKKAKAKGARQDSTTDDDGKGAGENDGNANGAADHHPHVEYDPDPVIIDEPLPANKNKPEQVPKVKSILRNRSDSLKEVEAAAVSDTGKVRSGFSRVPKDEVELKLHPEQKRRASLKALPSETSAGPVKSGGAVDGPSKVQPSFEDEIVETVQRVVASQVSQQPLAKEEAAEVARAAGYVEAEQVIPLPAETKRTKSKAARPAAEDVSALVASIQRAHLSKADVQVLVEALLVKDEASTSWTTKLQKNDPLALLTKQVEEKDRQLQEERQQAATTELQLNRQLKEVQDERSCAAQNEKLLNERASSLSAEVAALKARMQQTHEQHLREMSSVKQQSADPSVVQEQVAIISRLTQENQQLKQAMPLPSEMKALKDQAQVVQNELAKSIQNLTIVEGAKSMLEQKYRRLEEQMANKDLVSAKRLEELGQEMQRAAQLHRDQLSHLTATCAEAERSKAQAVQAALESEQQAKQLRNELHQTVASMDIAVKEKEKEVQSLRQQVNLLDSKQRMLSSSNHAASAELEDYKTRLAEGQVELRRLQARLDDSARDEAQSQLAAQVASSEAVQRLQALVDGQQKQIDDLQKDKIGQEQQVSELQQQHAVVQAKLQQELEEAKQRNNELRRKNWLLVETMESAEKLAAEVPDLKQQLENNMSAFAALKCQIKCLEEQNADMAQRQKLEAQASAAASEELASLRRELKECNDRERRCQTDLDVARKKFSELEDHYRQQLVSESAKHEAEKAALEESKAADLAHLHQQLRSRAFEIDSLQADLEVQQQTADAFKIKYDKAEKVDYQQAASSGISAETLSQLKAYQDEIAQLREQLSAKAVGSATLDLLKKNKSNDSESAATEALRKDVEAQRKKNNELREKNWKLVEALQHAEKQRDSKAVRVAQQPEHAELSFAQIKATISRLYPKLCIDGSLSEGAWLSQFESAVREQEQKAGASSTGHKQLLLQMDRELASLQAKLEAEERRWQADLASKDVELARVHEELRKVAL